MGAIIGMDPHKRSATIEVVDERGRMLATGRFGTDKAGYADLLEAGRRYPDRVWAIEGCTGIGRHIAYRLVHDGEAVFDVPAKLSAQVRVFATGNGRKTDPVDAHSVAMVALRTPNLVRVEVDDDLVVMGMLVDRRDELGQARTQTINRLHKLLLELFPGGAPQFLSSHKGRALIATIKPPRPGRQDQAPARSRADRRARGNRQPNQRPGGAVSTVWDRLVDRYAIATEQVHTAERRGDMAVANAEYLVQPRLKLLEESRRVVRCRTPRRMLAGARRECSRSGTPPPRRAGAASTGRQVPRPAERAGHRLRGAQDRSGRRPHRATGGRDRTDARCAVLLERRHRSIDLVREVTTAVSSICTYTSRPVQLSGLAVLFREILLRRPRAGCIEQWTAPDGDRAARNG
jgi:Transposase